MTIGTDRFAIERLIRKLMLVKRYDSHDIGAMVYCKNYDTGEKHYVEPKVKFILLREETLADIVTALATR